MRTSTVPGEARRAYPHKRRRRGPSIRKVAIGAAVPAAVVAASLFAAAPADAAALPGPFAVSASHWGQGTVIAFQDPFAAGPYTVTRHDASGATTSVPCNPSGTGSVLICTPGLATAAGDSWTVADSKGRTGGPALQAPRAMWVEDVHPATGNTAGWVFPASPATIVATAVADGIGDLFMAVPHGALTAQTAQYQALLADAQAAGIRVDALSGDPSWATDGGVGVTDFVQAVQAYNAVNPQAPFRGVHLDIEPWASSAWTTNQAGTVTGYLAALRTATSLAHAAGMTTEADITTWLNTIAVPGSAQDLAQAVQSEVDRVTIMSYQPSAASQFAYAQAELTELAPNGPVRMAADTVPGDAGSYAGQTLDAVWTQLATLDSLVSRNTTSADYLGVAFFDYGGTAQLSAGATTQVTVSAVPAPAAATALGTRSTAAAGTSAPTWTITVTVTGSKSVPPTGEVSVLRNGGYVAGGPLGAGGIATFTVALPSAAGLTARYSGDTVYAPARSLLPQAITLGPVPASATYGDRLTLSATGGGSGKPVVFSADSSSTAGACTVTPAGAVALTGVGTCVADANQAGTADYAPAPRVQARIKVTSARLTVAAASQSAVFGAPIPAPGYRYAGFVNGDTAATATTGSPACSTVPAGSPGGNYPITCAAGTLTAPNYVLSFVPGTLTITYTSAITTRHNGRLVVRSGHAVLIAPGAIVRGPVIVRPGGAVDIESAAIRGPVRARRASAVRMCSASIRGPIAVRATTGPVVIGDDDEIAASCGGNVLVGPVRLVASSGGVEFDGNNVTGPAVIAATGGTLPAPDHGSLDVSGNHVRGPFRVRA